MKQLVQRVQSSRASAEAKLNSTWDRLAEDGGEELLRAARELTARYPDDEDNPPRQPDTAPDVTALHEAARDNALPLCKAMRSFADAVGGASSFSSVLCVCAKVIHRRASQVRLCSDRRSSKSNGVRPWTGMPCAKR